MRFINFINESNYAEKISLDQCKELLHTYCPKNLELTKKGKILYRGDKKLNGKFIFLDKDKRKPRKSAHTSNHYNILTSELLPQWKEFPRRDMGVVCSTSTKKANKYGNIKIVIPFDDAKIAICPKNDFWSSFKWFKISDPSVLNSIMSDLDIKDTKSAISKFMKQKIITFKGKPRHLKLLKLNALLILKNIDVQSNSYSEEDYYKLEDATFGDLLEKMYDPTSNGFELISSLQNIKPNREVWFDGSAIMISNKIELQDI